MTLSPTLRLVLTAVLGTLGVAALVLADGWQPADLIPLAIAFITGLGIVPPQTGGTQQGVVKPAVTEPPAARVDEAGYGVVDAILIVFLCILVLVVLSWLL